MKELYDTTIEIKHIDQSKYDMLIDFLEGNNIDYEETDFEEYVVDERTESEKYDDWLSNRTDEIHDEQKIEE